MLGVERMQKMEKAGEAGVQRDKVQEEEEAKAREEQPVMFQGKQGEEGGEGSMEKVPS